MYRRVSLRAQGRPDRHRGTQVSLWERRSRFFRSIATHTSAARPVPRGHNSIPARNYVHRSCKLPDIPELMTLSLVTTAFLATRRLVTLAPTSPHSEVESWTTSMPVLTESPGSVERRLTRCVETNVRSWRIAPSACIFWLRWHGRFGFSSRRFGSGVPSLTQLQGSVGESQLTHDLKRVGIDPAVFPPTGQAPAAAYPKPCAPMAGSILP